MKINVLTSDENHPVYPYLIKWANSFSDSKHNISVVLDPMELQGGGILFLVSCSFIIPKNIRDLYEKVLVLHASDLPLGRGWSPHIWKILEGSNQITLSMLEAEDKVDTGAIWKKKVIKLEGHELYDEINDLIFQAELDLMTYAISNFQVAEAETQKEDQATYYNKRSPEDSRIDIRKPLIESFNLLRVADPNRFPAFFEHLGHKYIIKLEKVDSEHDT